MSCAFFSTAAYAAEELDTIKFRMSWSPQSQFAGVYVAHEAGIYEKYGLDVEISHQATDEDITMTLINGDTDVALSLFIPALFRAIEGYEVVNIGQITQSSALQLLARKDLGINDRKDLIGKRIAMWKSASVKAMTDAMLNVLGVHSHEEVFSFNNMNMLLYGGAVASFAMDYNEYFRMYSAGFDESNLTIYNASDLLPFLVDDGMYTMREKYEANKDAYARLLQATLEGWEYALDNKAYATEVVKKYVLNNGLSFDRARERWMLDTIEEIIRPDGVMSDGVLQIESFVEGLRMSVVNSNNLEYKEFFPVKVGN